MDLSNIEFKHNWPVYHTVAFEDAELQEIGDIFQYITTTWGYIVRDFGRKLSEGVKQVNKTLEPLFITNYQSEKHIQKQAPHHWFKWKYKRRR